MLALLTAVAVFADSPVPVRLVQIEKRFSLQRGGKPFFVKGVGGTQDLDDLVAIGGNSFRTWGADELAKDLEAARQHNLTVCAGIWIGHRRHGFKYDDPKMVADQKAKALKVVETFKNHPNLLVWGLGNEVELDGDEPKTYMAINDIAKEVKRLDPNHPTMTVIAEIGGNKIERIKTLCPDIDILGVNSYAGLPSLPERLQKAGWTKPYIVTEFGPPGPWETAKTPWGAPLEPTSTEKAEIYRRNYAAGIRSQDQCLGSYAFLWGHKQEGTATWFGMMLPSGEKMGAVDALAEAFGFPRTNRAPLIQGIDSPLANKAVPMNAIATATARVTDPNNDPMTYKWVLQREQTQKSTGGDAEAAPEVVETVTGGTSVTFKARLAAGGYRIFLFVSDGKGNAAVGNVPFLVQ